MTTATEHRLADYTVLGLSVFLIFACCSILYRAPGAGGLAGEVASARTAFSHRTSVHRHFSGTDGKDGPGMLTVAVLSALVTAILGFFLGKECR